MNIFFFYFILLFKYIICQNKDKEIKVNTFNDNFTRMIIKDDYALFYFGSELIYIIIHKNNTCNEKSLDLFSNITINGSGNNKSINFYFKNKTNNATENYTFKNDDQDLNLSIFNKTNHSNCIVINISNSEYSLILNLTENRTEDNYNQAYKNTKEIRYVFDIDEGTAVQLLRGENFFVEYFFFSYILIVFGWFLLLYGAYHFSIGVIFHITLFLFFYFNDIFEITFNYEISKLIYLYIFLCLIIGISMGIFLNTDKKNNKKYLLLKIFHGCSLGFSFYKLLILYYVFFGTSVDFDDNNTIYYAASIIFIFLGVIINLFNPFKQYIFLPASAVTGSYYFVKGIKYVIGGYYSENIAIRYKITFGYVNNKGEIISTYLIMTIILITFSIFCQINHIKQKQEEIPNEAINPENYEISRISDLSRTSNSIKPEEEKELIDKSNQNKTAEEDDDDINDQED